MLEEDRSIVHDVSLAAAVGRRALPMRLCTAFAESLGAQHVTMSLLPCLEQWQLLYANDEGALQAEAAQFAHGEGPSVDAALGARTAFIPDVHHTDNGRRTRPRRWSDELPALRHVLALPLHRKHGPLGVICLYYTHSAPPTPAQIAEAERATPLAGAELLRWRPLHADGPEPVWATDTRAARWERVHRAAGYVAAREDCPVGEALTWLRTTSLRRHQSLLDTCDHVLQPAGARADVRRQATLVS
ncbi:GAF domain-containing protein [Streptomyces sp. BH106]|uniref:GAF domain-containing protein n=1 Tax=Streptomyces sp. BH106 TaxID=3410409 RepID=UPI003CE70820